MKNFEVAHFGVHHSIFVSLFVPVGGIKKPEQGSGRFHQYRIINGPKSLRMYEAFY